MVFERISNTLSSNNSEAEEEIEGVAEEAMEEYEILKSEYQSDDFFQERIRKIIEEENVSIENLNVERGSRGKKLGKSVKLLGVIAEGIAIKTIVEVGISKLEKDVEKTEEILETQDSELYQAENKIEELEMRAEDLLEHELEDIKSVSDLESSISTIESNAETLDSMLQDSSIKEMNEEQNQKLGKHLKTVIEEIESLKQHQAIVSLERKVENDHIDVEMFQKLAAEIIQVSKNIEKMEKELENLENAVDLISESISLVESNSEIWMHNDSVKVLRRPHQLSIIEVLEDDSRLDRLSDFSSFNKQDFLTQLSSKNPGDLISESQEFQSRELDSFESQLQDLETEKERLEEEKEEIENQLQNIIQNASEIVDELESIESYIERLKEPSKKLVNSFESEISDIEGFESKLENYKEMKDQGKVSEIPEMERLISRNSDEGEKLGAEVVIQKADELLRSTTSDLEELISILESVEEELLKDEKSLKNVMQQLSSLDT